MTIVNNIVHWIEVFRQASSGRYYVESEGIKAIREEMFGKELTVRQNLRRDMSMLGHDWRAATSRLKDKPVK